MKDSASWSFLFSSELGVKGINKTVSVLFGTLDLHLVLTLNVELQLTLTLLFLLGGFMKF